MIDFHSHTLLSDGLLLPTELARRAQAKGYKALAITDHVDSSNLEDVLEKLLRFSDQYKAPDGFTLVVGVEITHVAPAQIGPMVTRARELGAQIIICHGETIVEPVIEGTNLASIEAGADILAHPGLITDSETELAAKNGVYLELTTRGGHSLTNGHVAASAKKNDANLVLNSDSHAPSDLITVEMARSVVLGAGLDESDLRRIQDNAQVLLDKVSR
ncbi:MAG: histidinol phosphate phosphatase domain-containing protein [Thermodesulfobacteriota bacterium]